MPLDFLRGIDRWIGGLLLYLLALPVRLADMLWPAEHGPRPRMVFLKLKGGGSLIIALPALLGLRRQYPQAEFILVCTGEARIYAELTGIFDRYVAIDDASLLTLAATGWRALRDCFHATICLDLEPNSVLAAVFTMLTCAGQRLGLVKQEQPARALAYVSAISFNPAAPIYIYYDQICEMLGGVPASARESRDAVRARLPAPAVEDSDRRTVGIAPFTSDFARERMMPAATWLLLLQRAYEGEKLRLLIFGSARNREAARDLAAGIETVLPALEIVELCGVCDLAQAAATLTLCDEVWAVDSGLLHLTRLLGVPSRSFWGPTMPSQRLRPIADLQEQVQYRPFICSPCVQASGPVPCGGHNLCMISMAEEHPDLQPSWVRKT